MFAFVALCLPSSVLSKRLVGKRPKWPFLCGVGRKTHMHLCYCTLHVYGIRKKQDIGVIEPV